MVEYFGLTIPFLDHLGVEPEEVGHGYVRIVLELQPEHCNSFGIAHGGVIMSLLDAAMGLAARSAHQHGGGAMTLDMSSSFMSGGHGRLIAEGRVLRSGRSINYCEAEVRNVDGELVAKSLGSFKLRRVNETSASPSTGSP